MTRKGLILFSLTGFIWGIPYFFIVIALQSFSTPTIVFLRTLLGATFLIPYAALTGGLKPALRAWPYVLVFAFVEMVVPWFLITETGKHISSGLIALLVGTVPFFAVAILATFLHDRKALKPRPLSGMIIGFLGVAALVGVDSFVGNIVPLHVLLVVPAALGYAIGAIVANRKLHDVPAGGVIGVSMIFASLVYAPLSLPNLPGEMAATSLESLLAVIILGLICSAAAFVLFFMLIREVGPAKSTLITFLNTAVALILGIVFLGEPITTGLVIGIPLIATGLWLAGGGELESELSKA